MTNIACYCGSNLEFSLCCQPFILGDKLAEHAQQLMRSRFSAYCDKSSAALHYIANTYHPTKQQLRAEHEIAAFARQAHFLELVILDQTPAVTLTHSACVAANLPEESQFLATVHFIVRYLLNGQLHVLEENSRFVFHQRWWYLDGELQPHPASKVGRNDLCPCGSGQKFKQCHL